MLRVYKTQGGTGHRTGLTTDHVYGFVSFVVVSLTLMAQYSAIGAVADGPLGMLASPAIAFLFVSSWFVTWLGFELRILNVARRGSENGDGWNS